jgi:3-oxoacyl-[acyl-carrier protein] reductase
MKLLAGKVALVTGGSRGIGAAIVRRLAADGADVVFQYNTRETEARALAEEPRHSGSRVEVIQADFADTKQVTALATRALHAFGLIDILVNNAAMGEFAELENIDERQIETTFKVNVTAPFILCREIAARLSQGGRIINIGSIIVSQPIAGRSVYGASKAAVHCFTKILAQELGPKGITVNAVAPGVTETERFRMADSRRRDDIIARTALGRIGAPADVASIVSFLAGPDSAWVTGEIIEASGGLIY